MTLVSELPAIVGDSALTKSNGRSVRLVDEESKMQVEVLTSAPLVAVRFGRGGVGHVSGSRKDVGAEQICDYLLVVETGADTHAVLVELKKTGNPRRGNSCAVHCRCWTTSGQRAKSSGGHRTMKPEYPRAIWSSAKSAD